MKKYLSIIIMMIVMLLAACKNEEETVTSNSLLQNSDISYLTVQFQLEKVKITKEDDIKKIQQLFEKNNFTLNENEVGEKVTAGWIYTIRTFDEKDKKLEEIVVVSDKLICYNGISYDCKEIDITIIDDVTGIDRFKTE